MREELLKEARAFPANFGPLRDASGNARITGPCGDTMEFWVLVQGGRIRQATFTTDGCGHSILSGCGAAKWAEGKTIEEAGKISQADVLEMVEGLPEDSRHCALLAANTLKAALGHYLAKYAPKECSCQQSASATKREEAGECRGSENGGLKEDESDRALQNRLSRIKHKIIVLSGKGGVGKSTVAVNLAVSLQLAGLRTGLLDVDIHGPSVPKMLGLEKERLAMAGGEIVPPEVGGLKVMSIGFLIPEADDPVIWRGPLKAGVIRQFIQDVAWGDLDVLVVDAPPGTGDEPLSVCQIMENPDGAVVVTTPQEVSVAAVRKSIAFCAKLNLPVLGVIENMSGFTCPHCGDRFALFGAGGGERMALEMGVPFLGALPLDPRIGQACDDGRPFVQLAPPTETVIGAARLFGPLLDRLGLGSPLPQNPGPSGPLVQEHPMRIAIPLADGRLATHFGHCERFAFLEVDPGRKEILKKEEVEAPAHEPGLLPRWLAERGVQVIIAGGMGHKAQDLFFQKKIEVVIGAPVEAPEKLVADYLAGTLKGGENLCNH